MILVIGASHRFRQEDHVVVSSSFVADAWSTVDPYVGRRRVQTHVLMAAYRRYERKNNTKNKSLLAIR